MPTAVSIDIIINPTWGDARQEGTRQLWLGATKDRHVVGFIAGPPCEILLFAGFPVSCVILMSFGALTRWL